VVTLERLSFPAGATVLRFTSDAPAQPESAAAVARLLAFAVYDPELR
jgi:hypothetical protein